VASRCQTMTAPIATTPSTHGTGDTGGNHHRRPPTLIGSSPTERGTVHSSTSDRCDRSTAGGGWGDIQWIRWSCHPYSPESETSCQSGSASALADGGSGTWAKRSWLIQ
jgi:hypothetical protein